MGSEASSLIIEPLVGIGIIALAILAIIEQRKNNVTAAEWSAIGALLATFALIATDITLAVTG